MRSIRDRKNIDGKSGMGGDSEKIRSEADEFAAKYAGLSENELMRALMQKVSAAKSTGTFSTEQLDDFVRFVSPELDESSRVRLAELVEMIKQG